MKTIAISIELLGIAVIGAGIAVEIVYQASIGLIAITVGSLLIAMGGFVWAKIIPQGALLK